MKCKYLLKSIYLLLISKSYVIITNKGSSMMLPAERPVLEDAQDVLEKFDIYLEELINDLILEERDDS
jgi:hypothetical protein